MADNPHFNFPFQLNGGHFAEVEQDSMEDLVACVYVALLTQQGWRDELPTFGVNDPTFQLQPVNISTIVDEITAHEPRAAILAEQSPDTLNVMIANVILQLSAQEDKPE